MRDCSRSCPIGGANRFSFREMKRLARLKHGRVAKLSNASAQLAGRGENEVTATGTKGTSTNTLPKSVSSTGSHGAQTRAIVEQVGFSCPTYGPGGSSTVKLEE